MSIPRSVEAANAAAMFGPLADAFDRYDPSSAWQEAADVFRLGVAQNFSSEQDSDGTQWPPRKDNLPHPLLRKSYRMHSAATTGSAPGSVTIAAGNSLSLGINLDVIPYARAQNFGHLYHRGGRTWYLPPREYYYASAETIAAVGRILGQQLLETLTR